MSDHSKLYKFPFLDVSIIFHPNLHFDLAKVCQFYRLQRTKLVSLACHEGVEHLLRDVKDATISTLATDVSAKLSALKGLKSRLKEIQEYLELVSGGKLPVNHDIMMYLQVCLSICWITSMHKLEGHTGSHWAAGRFEQHLWL